VKERKIMKKRLELRSYGIWMRRLLALSLWMLVGVGCATSPQSQVLPADSVATSPVIAEINNALTAAAQTPTASADYRLGPEDFIEITLFNVPESETGVTPRKTAVRVSQEGKITLPLLGDISVAGSTPSEVEQLLRQRYDRYLQNPQIGVQVKEYHSQQVSVIGAVERPNTFLLSGPKTLVDLLAMAGGVSGKASGQAHIYRQGEAGRQTHVIDLLALASNPDLVNMPVQGGDVINVPQAGMFFVDGAVGRPGTYPLLNSYTLTQALAVAGGVDETLADYSSVSIFRRQGGLESEILPVNLSQILDGKAKDPPIAPEDVIVVPRSTAKYLIDRFLGRIGLGSISGF
jgi:polysaccharide export outer membrane protein